MKRLRDLKFINSLLEAVKALAISVAVLFLAVSTVQGQTSFSNTAPIAFGDGGKEFPAAASPYPSNITVSGLSGTITKVTVTLNSFQHRFPDDVDILLVGPTGTNLIIMSDAGGFNESGQSVTLTFDDAAATQLPDADPLTSGTYKPTDYAGTGSEGFPQPAPVPSANTMLSAFNGTNPNGAWSLYVVDDEDVYSGSITGGWSLTITTATTTAASVSVSGRVMTAQGRGIRNVLVRLVDEAGEVKTVVTSTFGYYRFADVAAGRGYIISASAKKYTFTQPAQVLSLVGERDDVYFIADN
jgi:subtilisin-like proprotein convertase family protein